MTKANKQQGKFLSSLVFPLMTLYYLLFTIPPASPIFAQEWQTFDPNPLPNTGPGAATFKSLEAVFANILSVVFALAGFAAFIMLIVGGFRYLTSAGDPKAGAQARGTLTWAIAGLLFLIGAWFILSLISEFTGIPGLLKFQVPSN